MGSQDQIAATYGGFNKIEFHTNGDFKVKKLFTNKNNLLKLNKNLLLVYTGIKRTAHDIAKSYVNKLNSSKKAYIREISNLTEEAEKKLKRGELDDFGRLLHDSWLVKKKLSNTITNNKIDQIYNHAIQKGALGGKLLGAGGGGFILFYVPYYKQKNVIKSFKNLTTVPFKFTSEGSKIIFKKD